MTLDCSGVTPANVVPFRDGGETIHEADLRSHITDLVAHDGVNGILCNGHAGEVYALSREERSRVVECIDDVTDSTTPVISGVVGGSTTRVVEDAKRATAAGADALLVVPPHTPISTHPEAAMTFFRELSRETTVPLIVFQHPVWAGGTYDSELLARLVQIDGVIGVKDAVWDVDHYQDDVRAIRDGDADAQVLVANDEHLLPSMALRVDGIFLELAAVIPERIVALYEAIERSDLSTARAISEAIEPFVDAIYRAPITDSHTRLKVALELQGRIERATPRKPALPIDADERDGVERAMEGCGLLDDA